MTGSVQVRPATLGDVPGIGAVHKNCDDPWADPVECALWVNHRILRGFLVDVALVNEMVVGHAEWIVSNEPPPYGRHLYLGMIQVHADYRGRGIGRAMIETGMRRAIDRSCPAVRTVPEGDAKGFYRSCGFSPSLETETCTVKVEPRTLPPGWRRQRAAPRGVVRTLPMRWGWAQGSSAHIWEVCNHPVRLAAEDLRRPCAGRVDGRAFVQLHRWNKGPEAMAVSWAAQAQGTAKLVAAAMSLTQGLGIERLTVTRLKNGADLLTEYCDARRVDAGEVWSRAMPKPGDGD